MSKKKLKLKFTHAKGIPKKLRERAEKRMTALIKKGGR